MRRRPALLGCRFSLRRPRGSPVQLTMMPRNDEIAIFLRTSSNSKPLFPEADSRRDTSNTVARPLYAASGDAPP